ncbi:MAG: hypothetical protein MJZ29_09855, partial [Bacteroidaceae bacterium]|nr:hypothetical protein [Bacteroidaceae bacterium]
MRNIFRILCLLLLCNVAALAQTNTLTVPDVSVPKNGTISLPVQLDNTSDIVAVQFTLTMPEGFVLSEGQCALTERADGHAVRMKNMGNRRYMVMIMSGDNKYIKARTGSLLTVPLSPEYELMEGSEHQMALSDVVITSKDGKNVATGYSAGKITIATLPDFEVSAVTVSASDLVPGQQFDVNWTVKNIGHKESGAGWKEQIVLVDNDGNEKTLATVQNNDALNAGGVSSRSARITLPEQVGIDGEARIRVDLIPYSDAGEPAYLRENNTAFCGTTLNISKRLTLTPTTANVEEVNQQIRFYLARSGRTSQEESFPLVADADSRVSLPANVVIPQWQPGVYFYAQITANQRLDNDSIVNFAVSGNGYDEVKAKLVIEDDTYPKLSITASAQEILEGRSFTLTISTERVSANDIPVKLVSDSPSRIFIPSDIVIPAGKTSVDVLVDAIEDDVPDVEQVVVFTASAEKHESATLHTTVIDNDVPTLQLTLSPSEVSEDAGPESVVATIRRLDNVNKKVTINFSDDSNGNIHYSQQTIEMASGVQEMKVNLGPIDNNIVDGERTYNLSAAVWIASCSCNAANGTSGGVVTAPLTVYDNDGPALTVSASSSIMKEGEEITVTVSRNADLSKDVVVNVSSDHDSALEYPSSVTIPAGQTSTSFKVKAISNDVTGDDFQAVLTLQGNGFGKSTINISVSDQSMADAKVTGLTISALEAYAGDVVTANLSLANVGNSTLPAETKVAFYVDNSSTPVATTTLSSSLAAGESTTVSQEITVPFAIGNYNVYAKVNYDGAVAELSSSNNMSQYVPISILPPFTATVSVGKDAYNQGETINISGKVSGKDVANKTVEIYVINEGNRRAITVETDANGNFTADYTPIEGQIGSFSVGACYPSEGKDDELASFNVYGLKISAPWSEHSLAQNVEEKFTIEVTNPCSVPQNKIKVTAQAESDNCEFSFATISKLGAGESVTIECTAKPSQITSGRDFQKLPLTIASKEGASVEHILYYYVMPAYGKLESSVKEINTTMTLGTPRDYPLVIRNAGKGETGTITFALPSYITMATSKTVPSLASGDSTTVVLRINPTDKMQLNVPVTGRIGINCANGEGLAMPFSVTPVSTAKGKLKLSLVDEFTFYTAEAPRVSGATIEVKKPGTNEVVASGTSDANGSFEVELQEGYYALSVDAEHHDSYNNYILIDPDKTLEKEIFMSYQSVTYSWNVEETEIDDVYTFETKADFDVRVPKPIVIISLPKEFPEPYDVFPIVVTNKGLISAVDLHLSASAGNGYKLEFINNPRLDTIMPQQSEMFYARYLPIDAKQNAKRRANGATNPCQSIAVYGGFKYVCGKYTECVKIDEKFFKGTPACFDSGYGGGTPSFGLPTLYDALEDKSYLLGLNKEEEFCYVHGYMNCDKEIPVCKEGEEPVFDYALVNAEQCTMRVGAAADGVSQLKIILDPETSKLPAGNFKVTWYPFDEKYGKLIFPDNNKRTLNNVVYQAPDNFPGGLNEPEVVLTVKFDVKCDNYENTFEIPITITRPPLLLMHGL